MSDLPKRTLGRTRVEVTSLGFGAMELRAGVSEEEAANLLNAVLDAGINFIDTSIDYGRSEELIGKSIPTRRSEYFLASKCGCVPNAAQGSDHVHTAANIRAGVENSLRLLKTDHLDLVQFHRSLTQREFEEKGALQEAMKLKQEGKVRFVGVSATLPSMDEQVQMGVFDAFQVPYSALQREHEDVIARASKAGAGIIIRGGVARGSPTDWEQRRYYMLSSGDLRSRWEKSHLDDLLDGMSRMEFMLRFTLSDSNLDTTIVGTKNPDHLRENIAAAMRGPLPDAVVAEAKRRLAEAGSKPANPLPPSPIKQRGDRPEADHPSRASG
jgi:aryl-alcohol dehydrogenase-like predicted oxidoreductase